MANRHASMNAIGAMVTSRSYRVEMQSTGGCCNGCPFKKHFKGWFR